MAITKTEFIDRMAKKGGITKVEANRRVDVFIETLIGCLEEDGAVKFVGFGKFELKTVKERMGRNPQNGKECMIPEHKKVKFYASEGLSQRMKESEDSVDE